MANALTPHDPDERHAVAERTPFVEPMMPAYEQQSPEADAFAAFVEALLRRRLLCAALFAFTVVVVVGLTLITPKSYTTHVKFLGGAGGNANLPQAQTALPVLNVLLSASTGQSAETYAEMLREAPAVTRVIQTLNLDMSPDQLLSHVVVKPITNTAVIDVGVTWSSPEMSARVGNALADAFVDLRRDLVASQANSVILELNRQIPDAERRMSAAGAELVAFQSHAGIADIQAQTQETIAYINQLDTKLAMVEVDRKQVQASLAVVRSQIARTNAMTSGGGQTAPNPVVAQLETQLAQVDVQLKTALETYTENHPAVKALRAQQAEIRGVLARQPRTIQASQSTVANPLRQQLQQQEATLTSQLASDAAQADALGKQRRAAEPALRALPAQTQRLADLKRRAKSTEDVYDALVQKLNDATVAKTIALSDVTITQHALPETATVAPNLFLNIIVGTVLGFIVAITGALVVDYFDTTVKNEEDVEERFGLPLLGTMPMIGSPRRPAALWVRNVMIESVLHLVTSLRYAASGELKAIAITSASQGEGKSTVALNTAIAYAQLRPRVLLVDTDMRLPSIHTRLGIENDAGLSDVLVGAASFEEVLRSTQHSGLDVITSGTPTPSPLHLLESASFEAFLQRARELYEVVVLDATASGGVADAAAVCSRSDGTVFVISRGETDARAVRRAMARLRHAGVTNLLGAVLNKVVPRRSEIGAYGESGSDGERSFPLPPARSA